MSPYRGIISLHTAQVLVANVEECHAQPATEPIREFHKILFVDRAQYG